ncbi:hypothetical protein DL768_009817 [Monosporascus sp. mg162]|nr:hypothetical protein DL768_009817 [Monosporascus sp. mg162]
MADRSKKRQCDQEVPGLIGEDKPRKRLATRTQPVSSYDLGDSRHGSSRLAALSSFVGQGIQHSGTGPFQVHGNLNIGAVHHSQKPPQCLADLRSTDPRHDKKRIEQTKGGLLRESYRWILDHHDFLRWRDDPESRILWIKGDPGKGKTMLLCGIIDELNNQNAHTEQTANITHLLSFFFCQATDDRLNNATGVLRGLIYLLADQQRPLLLHIQNKYNHAGKALFEDVNAWVALREILMNILLDPDFPNAILIIDALDECETDLSQLLDLIMEVSPRSRVNLDDPGLPVDEVTSPDPDPLAAARYSCIHWVDHLAECSPDEQAQYKDLRDGGMIDRFLRRHYLHWLEALSILGSISEGILAMSKLDKIFQPAVEHNWSACLSTLEGHGSDVFLVAFSPDGSRLASGSWDRTVKVWDAATGACLSTLKGHGGGVRSVAFSPDGSRLASGSNDGTVKVWDAATGAYLSTFEGHGGGVWSVAFSPDASRLASGSGSDSDGTVEVWNAATGACLSTLEGHGGDVRSVAFSPDGSRLASGSSDDTVKVWDAATGACLSTFEGYGGWPHSVAFSPDGNYLTTAIS